jgi:hypothetical protein
LNRTNYYALENFEKSGVLTENLIRKNEKKHQKTKKNLKKFPEYEAT